MSRYLEMVDEPKHVKKLTLEQLRQLAEEIRYELITVLSKNGGHLGPNLGVVELTIALHHVFNTPKDKFVWDVSHQVYVHKLLTGRKDRFHTIRTDGRLERLRACAPRVRTIATARATPAPRCPPRSAWRPRATSAARMKTSSASSATRR